MFMSLYRFRVFPVLLLSLCFACTPAEQELPKVMAVSVSVNGRRADNGSVGDIPADGASIEFYNVDGRRLERAQKGVIVMKMTRADGSIVARKLNVK